MAAHSPGPASVTHVIAYQCAAANNPCRSKTALLWRGACHGLPCTLLLPYAPGCIWKRSSAGVNTEARQASGAPREGCKVAHPKQCQAPPPPPPLPGLHEGWRVPAGPPAGPQGLTFDTAPCGHPCRDILLAGLICERPCWDPTLEMSPCARPCSCMRLLLQTAMLPVSLRSKRSCVSQRWRSLWSAQRHLCAV